MVNLDDWREEHAEALAAASKLASRQERGIPPDRWATTRELHLVASGIRCLQQIIAMQTEVIEAMTRKDA